MSPFRRTRVLWSLSLLGACERAKTAPPLDSAVIRPAGTSDTVARVQVSKWDESAGPVLLVAGETPSRALVVVPDSAAGATVLSALPQPASATLFSRSGTVQTADIPVLSDSGGCVAGALNAAPPPRPWSVGFIGGVVAPLAMDSLEAIPRADSASLVIWMNRLASGLPNDPAGRFVGLPFVVNALWRIKVPGGAPTVVARLSRQINQEATPLQEHTLIIAEPVAGDSSFSLAYSERSYGDEETIERVDVLAAALFGSDRTPVLIVARDFGDATAYGTIERVPNGKWRARWSSVRRRC